MKAKFISIFVILISLLCIQSFVYAAEDDSSANVTWTDFSKAQYKVEKSVSTVSLSISNVTMNLESTYSYLITATNTKPSIDLSTTFDKGPYFSSKSSIALTPYVELNQDLYLWIIERQYDEVDKDFKYKYVVEGKKLNRPEYPTYADVFFATDMTNKDTQILFNVPMDDSHSRKINVKIGKIDDATILNKIKNKESDAFQKLLEYSKQSNTIYNKQLTSSKRATSYFNRI